jgi:hypothetical protein
MRDELAMIDDPRFERSPGVPEHIRGGLIRFVDHGILPGGFLQAVLSNDLPEACARADDENRPRLFAIVRWLWNEAPATCWGSPEAMRAWNAKHEEAQADG